MKAYHGDEMVKAKYLARVQAHRAADELIQGATQGRGRDGTFRGCAVVCTLERYEHSGYEAELGVPRALARLEDGIFEGLPAQEAMGWPEAFLEAIPVGADLSLVSARFLHWLLVDPTDGVIRFAKSEKSRPAIEQVAALFVRKISGEIVPVEEWKKARASADAYAAAYAYASASAAAYAYASADASADAYAAAAAYAAAYAADAAASADAYAYACKQNARRKQAEKLLELLRAAPAAVEAV